MTETFPTEYFPPTPLGIKSLDEAGDYLNSRRRQLAVTIGNLLDLAMAAAQAGDFDAARQLLDSAAPYIAARDRMRGRHS